MLKYNLSQIDSVSKKIISNLTSTDFILLFGELGSGKTTFTRSLINQIQEKNKIEKTEVLSPTFNILYEYNIRSLKIMHYDLYRLNSPKEAEQLGIFENFKKTLTIIEWPEKIKNNFENRLEITFFQENEEESCWLKFQGFGKWRNFKLNAI